MPTRTVQIQYVYYDTKSKEVFGSRVSIKAKAKLAGSGVLLNNVYRFFELTTRDTRMNERHRVHIERPHLEGLSTSDTRLGSDEGYIKLTDPEHLSEQEVQSKMGDRRNGFDEIARLCDEKWEEMKRKIRDPAFRETFSVVSRDRHIDSVLASTNPMYEDPDYVLEQLGLA